MKHLSEFSGLELRSTVTSEGTLRLSLDHVEYGPPAGDELLVRMEAAPVNPSDLGVLLAGIDPAGLEIEDTGTGRSLAGKIPAGAMAGLVGRTDQALPVGLEGSGVVVAAGAAAQHMIGKTVAMMGAGSYAQYRRIHPSACLELPEGTRPEAGAGALVNPMTALSMVETMKREGHHALVHTAAASNLGQMLNRICIADGIGLVNIVRSPTQAALLRGIGATHVCDSSASSFNDDLRRAVEATGATLGFDAVGGGELASHILLAMEAALLRSATAYSRYGSTVHKQVYLYGGLSTGPTIIHRNFGMAWGVGGWLLMPFLESIGAVATQGLKDRVVRELETTFASSYAKTVPLADLLDKDTLSAMAARSTATKYLVRPNA